METLRYVLLANALLAIVSLAYYALLRRETFFGANRLALWLGLAGALLLPLLELPDWRPQSVRTVMHRTAQVIVPRVLPSQAPSQPDVTIMFPDRKTYQAFQSQPAKFVWSWQLGVLLLYVIGIFLLLIRFGTQLVSLRRLIRQSVHEPYNDFILVRNAGITSPFSFFDWVVLNPDQHSPDELEQILRHERVHVRERHSFDMIGAELVCIFFWFNPAVYLFRQLLHQTLEFSADRAVLSEGVDAKAYQYNLVKVSMSAGQSASINHFSKSQLKSRIAMLNKPESPKASWLKYPVLCIAALTVASAFARPKYTKALSRYVSKPLVETIAAITEQSKGPLQLVTESDQLVGIKPVEPEIDKNSVPKSSIKQSRFQLDSVNEQPKRDSVRVSPSRYMLYKGDLLFWIVTPKTTFDDLAIMKQEFAKYGHTMQLNEIKYDPLYAYINRIVLSVIRPSGGGTSCDELNDDNKPILSIAGYIGTASTSGGSGTGGLRYYKEYEFPESLRKTAVEEEAAIAAFIKDRRMEYLVQEGNQKFKDLGSGSSRYSKAFFQNNSTESSGLVINPDGSLAVREELGSIRIFINNEPVERAAVGMWSAKQLYAVVNKSYYNPARKESFTSALLIYTTEDN